LNRLRTKWQVLKKSNYRELGRQTLTLFLSEDFVFPEVSPVKTKDIPKAMDGAGEFHDQVDNFKEISLIINDN
jgi:hypothetical protein